MVEASSTTLQHQDQGDANTRSLLYENYGGWSAFFETLGPEVTHIIRILCFAIPQCVFYFAWFAFVQFFQHKL